MLTQNPKNDAPQDDLFHSRLDQLIDMRHPLVKMSRLIDWDGLEAGYAAHYCTDNG